MKVLIVEDTMEDLALLKNIIDEVSPSTQLLVHDSFEGVVNEVINDEIKPDAAIIDMQIFQTSGKRRKMENPDVSFGIEMAIRLLAIGMQEKSILVLTVLPQDVDQKLKAAGYSRVKIVPKDTYPAKMKRLIAEFLSEQR